ncbi:MAG: choice-of-anchor D domain-containing protein [bacterium]
MIKKIFQLLPVIHLLFFYQTSSAQTVTRGPYLQVGTPNSIIVRWRTDTATDSRVVYGTTIGQLNMNMQSALVTTEHEIKLSGLQPDTKYYYAIGTRTTNLAGGDSSHFFITSPGPGSNKATRIWVLGDSGTRNSRARAVRDAYYNFTGTRHTDLWLMLGDNAYSSGADQQYQDAVFERMYEEMLRKSVLWPTLGNHDDNTASTPGPYPYYDIFTLPTNGEAGGIASGTEAYYSFDYGSIHFICLNSTTANLRQPGSPMWVWLEEDLAANDKNWIIAFWHHPPYSKGSHNSDRENELVTMREVALPILEDYGVDLVLAGHSHSYERSFLLDRHYDVSSTLADSMIIDGGNGRTDGDGAYNKSHLNPTPHEGAVYVVAGSSGKLGSGRLDHPVMVTSLKEHGSVALDVDDNRLDATFIDKFGAIRDYFTIIKGSGSAPATKLVLASQIQYVGVIGSNVPFPFVVETRDINDNPVAGVTVTFEVVAGTGSLSDSQPQLTGADGRAASTLTLGMTADTTLVSATSDGLANSPIIFTGIAILPPAPEIAVNPAQHDFGQVFVDSSALQSFVVSNRGTADLQVTDITLTGSDSAAFSIENGATPFTVLPGDSVEWVVRFQPASPGMKSTTLRLASNDPQNNPLDVSLTGEGVMMPQPQIAVQPPAYDYGEVTVDSSRAQKFVVMNTGSSELYVTGISLTGGDADAFKLDSGSVPFTLASDDTQQIVVSFHPTSVGNKSAVLRFTSNDAQNNPLELDLTGEAVLSQLPQIAVEPSSFNYGEVVIDSSAAQAFVVFNTGTAELSVTGITLSGENRDAFKIEDGSSPFSLLPGDSQQVAVSFMPKTEGLKSAVLRIESNDADDNPIEVPLSGTAKTKNTVSVNPRPSDAIPAQLRLSANYPNPFNAETIIEYALPEATEVRLTVYNNLGQLIRVLVDESQSAGVKKVVWNGTIRTGQTAVSGTYYVRLEAQGRKIVRRMILQK